VASLAPAGAGRTLLSRVYIPGSWSSVGFPLPRFGLICQTCHQGRNAKGGRWALPGNGETGSGKGLEAMSAPLLRADAQRQVSATLVVQVAFYFTRRRCEPLRFGTMKAAFWQEMST
jgi:hypothetical protein